jgi:uncharacterized coiled-coil DUF342 family protein
MKKLTKFKAESEKINKRAEELNTELQSLHTKLSQTQRLLNDLMIQQELEPERASDFEKDIAKKRAEEKKLLESIKSVSERLEAFKEARGRKLESLRDEAKADVEKEGDKLLKEFATKLHDIRQARGEIIRLLLEMHETREKARSVTDEFVNLSRQVDDQFDKMRNPVPLYNVKALSDNTAGHHAPILPFHSEMQWALEGRAPQWFDYWKLTGEILSPAEIAAKNK